MRRLVTYSCIIAIGCVGVFIGAQTVDSRAKKDMDKTRQGHEINMKRRQGMTTSTDLIKFETVSFIPNSKAPLPRGRVVEFECVYEYSVDRLPARVKFVIQYGEFTVDLSQMILFSKTTELSEKQGQVTFSGEVLVPRTESVLFHAYITTAANNEPHRESEKFVRIPTQ